MNLVNPSTSNKESLKLVNSNTTQLTTTSKQIQGVILHGIEQLLASWGLVNFCIPLATCSLTELYWCVGLGSSPVSQSGGQDPRSHQSG